MLTELLEQFTPVFLHSPDVAPQDTGMADSNYQKDVWGALTRPVTFRFNAVRKNGETFTAETEMIPISWNGYPIAYQFVREIR